MSFESKMSNLAKSIRAKAGVNTKLSIDGMAAAVETIAQEGPTVFTNVLSLASTIVKQGVYWSPSGATWANLPAQYKDAAHSIVFEVPSGSVRIRIRGPRTFPIAYANSGSQVLLSNDPSSGWVNQGRWYDLRSVDEYGDMVLTINNSGGYRYCTFVLDTNGTDESAFSDTIVTVNEPIGNGGHSAVEAPPEDESIDMTQKTWQRGLIVSYRDTITGADTYGLYTISYRRFFHLDGKASSVHFSVPDTHEMRISIASGGVSADAHYVAWSSNCTIGVSDCYNHDITISVRRKDKTEITDAEVPALSALISIEVSYEKTILIADQPTTLAQLACLARIKQMRDIVYTPIAPLPYNGNDGYYPAGEAVTGLPYSSVRKTDKFIGFNVSLHTFMTALQNPKSVLYTKESTSYHAKTWYGTNCSSFVSYSFDWPYHIPTAVFASMDCVEQIAVEDMRLCDAGNMIDDGASGGHVVIISGIVRDLSGKIVTVEISQSDGIKVSSTSMPYDAFISDYIVAQGYKMYRNTELYKISYTPSQYIRLFDDEPFVDVAYSDLCTDLGDKATISTEETITLNPINANGYTAIKLYKDGAEIASYDVADIELIGLTPGKYEAKLYPEKENASTSFIVCSVSAAHEGNRYLFSGIGGTPSRIVIKDSVGFTLRSVELTEADIFNGYKDLDYENDAIFEICVPFRTEYGFVVARCNY